MTVCKTAKLLTFLLINSMWMFIMHSRWQKVCFVVQKRKQCRSDYEHFTGKTRSAKAFYGTKAFYSMKAFYGVKAFYGMKVLNGTKASSGTKVFVYNMSVLPFQR